MPNHKTRNLHKILLSLLSPALVLLAGCANQSPFFPPAATLQNFSGNWSISGGPTNYSSFALGGLLTAQQGKVTGLMRVLNGSNDSPCIDTGSVMSFTGSVDSKGMFTLTSTSTSGAVLTITGSMGTGNGGLVTEKSPYQITGSCQSQGITESQSLPFIEGSYSGPSQDGSNSVTLTADFHEFSNINSAGEFPMTGSLSFQGLPCLTKVTMDPSASYVSGSTIVAQFLGVDNTGAPVTVAVSGYYTTVAMLLNYTVTGGSCAGYFGRVEMPFAAQSMATLSAN